MTIDERLDRIEHVTAGLGEQFQREREENRQLWRGTQRQLDELTARMNDLTARVADSNDAIARFAAESREADKRLELRIESLVSAMGEFLSRQR